MLLVVLFGRALLGCSDDGIYEPEPAVDAGIDVCMASDQIDGPPCEEPAP